MLPARFARRIFVPFVFTVETPMTTSKSEKKSPGAQNTPKSSPGALRAPYLYFLCIHNGKTHNNFKSQNSKAFQK